MRIRRATRRDANGIARVHAESWRTTYATMLPDTYLDQLRIRSLAREWRRTIETRHTIVAVETDGKREHVVGFAQLGRGRSQNPEWRRMLGEIHMLYVEPERQSDGVGGALLRASMRALEQSNMMWMHVWVLEDNLSARRFYERHGLQADGRSRIDRFHGQQVRVVRYARALNSLWEAVVR